MKTKTLLALTLGMLLALGACKKKQEPTQADDSTNTNANTTIGQHMAPYAVGDVVFTDGSASAWNAGEFTDVQKQAAVAYIFYSGTELNDNDDTRVRTLGVGFKTEKLPWCIEGAAGYDLHFDNIEQSVRNGSNHLALMAQFLGENDDTDEEGYYPAFHYCKNYKDIEDSRVAGTSMEDGWYLPSLAEMKQVYGHMATLVDITTACGNGFFLAEDWLTATQGFMPSWPSSHTKGACYQTNGTYGIRDKATVTRFCAIREF